MRYEKPRTSLFMKFLLVFALLSVVTLSFKAIYAQDGNSSTATIAKDLTVTVVDSDNKTIETIIVEKAKGAETAIEKIEKVEVLPELSYFEALKEFYKVFGEYKDAPKYGLYMIIIQLLMLLMKTPLASATKGFKLVVVSFLALASAIVLGLMTGANLSVMLQDATVVSALSVFANQSYKKIKGKKD